MLLRKNDVEYEIDDKDNSYSAFIRAGFEPIEEAKEEEEEEVTEEKIIDEKPKKGKKEGK